MLSSQNKKSRMPLNLKTILSIIIAGFLLLAYQPTNEPSIHKCPKEPKSLNFSPLCFVSVMHNMDILWKAPPFIFLYWLNPIRLVNVLNVLSRLYQLIHEKRIYISLVHMMCPTTANFNFPLLPTTIHYFYKAFSIKYAQYMRQLPVDENVINVLT